MDEVLYMDDDTLSDELVLKTLCCTQKQKQHSCAVYAHIQHPQVQVRRVESQPKNTNDSEKPKQIDICWINNSFSL